IVDALSDAQPDTEAITRAKSDDTPASGTTHTTTPTGPNKRRKETHESPATNGANGHLSSPAKAPVTQPKAKTPPTST
ncbi:2186_t:CDS:1, partial [Acaulospora colombiana]